MRGYEGCCAVCRNIENVDWICMVLKGVDESLRNV